MNALHKWLLLGTVLTLSAFTTSAAPVIITSAEIDGYFGTATILAPGGATLLTQNYLFLTNPISDDLAFDITHDSNAALFPIFQNGVGQFATLDASVFVQEINNDFCQPAGPQCDPSNPLPNLPASANLTQALYNLAGSSAFNLTDTGNVFKGNVQYVVSGFGTDGTTIIQASINMNLFEHDLTATVVPEPATWLLILVAAPSAFVLRGRNRKR